LPVSGEQYDPYRPILASLLFAHLLRTTETIKKMARAITFPSADEDDDEDPQTLVGVVVGNLVMAAREQTEVANREAKDGVPAGGREMTGRDWSRAQVGWLLILCQWLWDSPKTVKEFLSEGSHLQVVSSLSLRQTLSGAANSALTLPPIAHSADRSVLGR
jgi:intracellular protein transport protein USO1